MIDRSHYYSFEVGIARRPWQPSRSTASGSIPKCMPFVSLLAALRNHTPLTLAERTGRKVTVKNSK